MACDPSVLATSVEVHWLRRWHDCCYCIATMGALSLLLPDEAIVLVLVAAGLAVMFGAKRLASSLFGLFVTMLLLPLFLPFVDGMLDAMPLWMLLIAVVWVGLAIFRGAAGLMVGRHAGDAAVGHVLGVAIVGVFRLLFLPLRWLFRRRRY